jgi:type III restriction enzyme
MAEFKFGLEGDLDHQKKAVESTIAVFDELEIIPANAIDKQFVNPVLSYKTTKYVKNIIDIRKNNNIKDGEVKKESNIIDIMMETGTGKTYTYTKTIFELNKLYGIFKFVIIVPTLSIKAGTVNFLKSDSSRDHFKQLYGKTLNLHIVESKKGGKSKKFYLPESIESFVNSGTFEKTHIQVMIINAGMINSETMQKELTKTLLEKYAVPFDAVAATCPFLIIDEPHKFIQGNKTWENIQKLKPQFILRYGATFPDKLIKQKDILSVKNKTIVIKDYHNLIYTLTAVDSFNNRLIKGVVGHITEFETGKNAILRFINSDGQEASFELVDGADKKSSKASKGDSLEKIHPAMSDLFIENLNKSIVVLSNGVELKKGDKISPYSYSETLQETMIQKAVRSHFVLEREMLKREVKIKPLTLFFIDNINEYREADGHIKKTVEKFIKAEAAELLKTETDDFYKGYLEKTLLDISKTHGGYFSKDNNEKDEAIEQEIVEILHDKEKMLSLDNPRRFIFSKWTLREGWDNPNVFQICKLRSSGSEISKLQEVGRGLRLPVNEYGNRVKDEQFYLNYFVDFTENDFVEKLVNEINKKSGAISLEVHHTKLSDDMIKQIFEKYKITEDELLAKLDDAGVIKRNNDFKENGFEYIKSNYPLIFEGINSNSITKSTDQKKKITIRTKKYDELKELWEKINTKVVLEYKIKNEDQFAKLLVDFLNSPDLMTQEGLINRRVIMGIEDNQAVANEKISIKDSQVTKISTMHYDEFLKQLSRSLNINIKTLHQSFVRSSININNYLNNSNIKTLKKKFDNYLMNKSIDAFGIEYHKVTNVIHPTKLTDAKGNVKSEIDSVPIGRHYSNEKVADNYLLDELFYDSELEKENIKENITDVVVFTKIPSKSIKIPVAGGKSYSPDFAYVINLEDGKKKLYFIVETKNKDKENLMDEESKKIKHAEEFFSDAIKITFKTQFSNKKIINIIKEVYNNKS